MGGEWLHESVSKGFDMKTRLCDKTMEVSFSFTHSNN